MWEKAAFPCQEPIYRASSFKNCRIPSPFFFEKIRENGKGTKRKKKGGIGLNIWTFDIAPHGISTINFEV